MHFLVDCRLKTDCGGYCRWTEGEAEGDEDDLTVGYREHRRKVWTRRMGDMDMMDAAAWEDMAHFLFVGVVVDCCVEFDVVDGREVKLMVPKKWVGCVVVVVVWRRATMMMNV